MSVASERAGAGARADHEGASKCFIVARAAAGDLAITADIPLAARLLAKKLIVLNPRGEKYDAENVGERLSMRDFLSEARDHGIVTGGPSAYGPNDKQRFANALDRALYRVPYGSLSYVGSWLKLRTA